MVFPFTGLITSSQMLAYTGSKFLGGLVSDHVSPRILFSTCLLLSGILTAAFTSNVLTANLYYTLLLAVKSVHLWAIMWFLLGFVQGGGWPSCAKILRQVSFRFTFYCIVLYYAVVFSGGVWNMVVNTKYFNERCWQRWSAGGCLDYS